MLAYYYIAETNIAYIRRSIDLSGMMFVLKLVIMSAVFYGTVKTTKPAMIALRDYEAQQAAGVTDFTFNPIKLRIKNATYWEKRYAAVKKTSITGRDSAQESDLVTFS